MKKTSSIILNIVKYVFVLLTIKIEILNQFSLHL